VYYFEIDSLHVYIIDLVSYRNRLAQKKQAKQIPSKLIKKGVRGSERRIYRSDTYESSILAMHVACVCSITTNGTSHGRHRVGNLRREASSGKRKAPVTLISTVLLLHASILVHVYAPIAHDPKCQTSRQANH
jgi:hypothetical protein